MKNNYFLRILKILQAVVFFLLFVSVFHLQAASSYPGKIQPVDSTVKDSIISNISNQYFLGSGDVVSIRVFGEKEISGDYILDENGFITLPLIGNIKADQKTVMQLQQDITNKLKEYIRNPVVTVFVKKYNSQKVIIFGDIHSRSKAYVLKGPTRILTLIAEIGGFTPDADISHVELEKKNGKTKTIDFNKILSGRESENVFVKAGSVIYVPSMLKLAALEKAKRIKILILGEVKSPGIYMFNVVPRLSDIITKAGGYIPYANISQVRIIRGRLKKPTIISQNFGEFLKTGNLKDDIDLVKNDIVFVPRSFMGNVNYFVNAIIPTLSAIGWGEVIAHYGY